MASLNGIARLLLPVLSVAAVYGCWVMSFKNGTFGRISQIQQVGPQILPNTNQPIFRHYTGIDAIDDQLTVLVLFFWGIVDGSHPNLSLQCFYAEGQFAAVWTILMIESFRVGNKWRLVSFTAIWGVIMQNVAFGVTVPVFLTLHLLTSPTTLELSIGHTKAAAASLIAHPTELRIVPFSILLGFLVPTVLMCLPAPSVVTFERKQLFVVIWQTFPLLISLWQIVLSILWSIFLGSKAASSQSAAGRNASVLQALRHTYLFAFVMSSSTHVVGLGLSLTSLLCPAIFAPGYPLQFHPLQIFVPKNPFSVAKVSSIGEGSLNFMQYDIWIGCAATLLWALVLNRNAHKGAIGLGGWVSLVTKVAGLVVLAGPGSAIVALMWGRDELILGEVDEKGLKKTI